MGAAARDVAAARRWLRGSGLGERFARSRGPYSVLDPRFELGLRFRLAAAEWLARTDAGCLTWVAIDERPAAHDTLVRGLVDLRELPAGFDEAWLAARPPPHRGFFLLRPVPGRVHLLLLQDDAKTARHELEGPIDLVVGEASSCPQRPPPALPGTVTVVGAGLAGACVARQLADHRIAVRVVDRGPPPGSSETAHPRRSTRGSTNPWLLCRPHLAAGNDPLAALTRAGWQLRGSYGHALRPLRAFAMAARGGKLAGHHTKLVERWRGSPWQAPLPRHAVASLQDGYAQTEAGVLDGPAAIRHLLDGIDVTWGTDEVAGGPAILCTGAPPRELGGRPLAGTVAYSGSRALADIAVGGGLYLADGGRGTIVGATRHRGSAIPPDDAVTLLAAAAERFGLALGPLQDSWSGVRIKMRDHLPVVGPWPDPGGHRTSISAGHGSKGSAIAPIAAALVVARWLGLPWPIPRTLARAIRPDRPSLTPR